MKHYIHLLVLLSFIVSCQKLKDNKKVIKEDIQTELLKEIEAYKIVTGEGDVIVAIHNNRICSARYFSGKIEKTILMIDKEKAIRLIEVDKIIEENDSFLIVKKVD